MKSPYKTDIFGLKKPQQRVDIIFCITEPGTLLLYLTSFYPVNISGQTS